MNEPAAGARRDKRIQDTRHESGSPEGAKPGRSPRLRGRAVSYGTLCGLAALIAALWLLCSPRG